MKNKLLKLDLQYFGGKSPDMRSGEGEDRIAIMRDMSAAIMAEDKAGYEAAMNALSTSIENSVLDRYRDTQLFQNDQAVLAQRGVPVLTSEERTYMQRVTEAMKNGNPQMALEGLELVLPKTTFNRIFDNLKGDYPLLEEIDFQNTGALVEIILSKSSGVAGWGELCDEIDKELSGEFEIVNLAQKKLYAFMPVCSAMLDIGPEWLHEWVVGVISDSIAAQLEVAIVSGDGKVSPIGMNRKLTGAVDGVYPEKDTVVINALDPKTLGEMLNIISVGYNKKRRPVPRLLMVVSYGDYYTKVYPASTVRQSNGHWATNVFPYDIKVVPSVALADGKAIFGLAKKYMMALGTSRGGKLEYSDHYKWLEHARVYRMFLYGNGRATDENAFVYADINGLKPTVQQVEVVNMPAGGVLPTGAPLGSPPDDSLRKMLEAMTEEELLQYAGQNNIDLGNTKSKTGYIGKIIEQSQ